MYDFAKDSRICRLPLSCMLVCGKQPPKPHLSTLGHPLVPASPLLEGRARGPALPLSFVTLGT